MKLSHLSALLFVAGFAAAPAFSAEAIKVNGQSISPIVYDAFLNEQKDQGAADSTELKEAVREELIRREIMSQEAKKKGLDKKPDVQGQMELTQQAILIRAYLTDYLKSHPVSDAQLKADYDKINTTLGKTEYKVRHILVEKEGDAKAIIEKLAKGSKFADLAKQSKDTGSSERGGELGWSAPSAFVKPFADALTTLKKGEYTKTPVKSDFGYHVIMLDDSRALTPPPFDQVKPQLQQRASQIQVEDLVKELRAKAKVE